MRHYLSANAESRIPSNLLFVDTESYQHRDKASPTTRYLSLRYWHAIAVRLEGGKQTRVVAANGTDCESFWQFHATRLVADKPLWTWAHNLPHDMCQLDIWEELDSRRLTLDGSYSQPRTMKDGREKKRKGIIVMDGVPAFCTLYKDGHKCRFVDSMNYWPIPLHELGESIGLPKLNVDPLSCSDSQLAKYCERDVMILRQAVCSLLLGWKREKLGNFRVTAAGLSLQSFRHLCCDNRQPQICGKDRYNILIDTESKSADLEEQSYSGGRIEAFYMGHVKEKPAMYDWQYHADNGRPFGPVHKLDVSSMYPSVMSTELYPIEPIKDLSGATPFELSMWLPAYSATAAVRIQSRTNTYPVKREGVTYHCSGDFWSVLCGRELERAIRAGDVKKVGRCAIYINGPIFRDWVDLWWGKRQAAIAAGDTATARLCKLVINSLYGKFAQRGFKWEDRPDIPTMRRWGTFEHVDLAADKSYSCRAIAGYVQARTDGQRPEHSFPAISAHITANARERLRDLITTCPPKSVLLVNTDMMLVTDTGLSALIQAGEVAENTLGKLRLEGSYDTAEICGSTNYRIGWDYVISGHWANAELGADGKWRADEWQRGKAILADKPDGTIRIRATEQVEPIPRVKGEHHPDGWITPFHLDPITLTKAARAALDDSKRKGL